MRSSPTCRPPNAALFTLPSCSSGLPIGAPEPHPIRAVLSADAVATGDVGAERRSDNDTSPWLAYRRPRLRVPQPGGPVRGRGHYPPAIGAERRMENLVVMSQGRRDWEQPRQSLRQRFDRLGEQRALVGGGAWPGGERQFHGIGIMALEPCRLRQSGQRPLLVGTRYPLGGGISAQTGLRDTLGY